MDHMIENKAFTLLENFNLDRLPIDVESLASELGIKIIEENFDDDIAGLLYSKESKSFIGININHHENRKRFTIGHEIGHYVLLHHKLNSGIHVDSKSFIFRRTNNNTDDEIKEKEANKFAASLLMPAKLLKKFIEEEEIDLNDELDIYRLSTKIKVSEQALTYRLLNLGLINYS